MFNSKSLPTSLAALILAATSASASAPEVESSQQGVTYSASLPVSANTQVNGFVKGSSAPDGQGCSFQIVINNVPSQNAPYQYQIADSSVASAGGCPASSSLLNPYVGQPNAACDDEKQSQCAIGALSGKHGAMEAGFFSANYVDLYLSTSNGTDAFFGNKAFVVLDSNQNVITCADFVMDEIVTATSSSSTAHATGTASATRGNTEASATSDSTSETSTAPNAGPKNAAVGAGAAVLGLAALFL